MAILFEVLDTVTGKRKFQSSASSTQQEQETPTGLVNGLNQEFTVVFTPFSVNTVFVYLDGLLVKNSSYSVNIGLKKVTFTTAPSPGQDVYVVYTR